jgi:hypothetical protein
MTKKLPAKIFVKWDHPSGNDEAYLLADSQMYGLVDTGRKKSIIGTYQLVETTEAEMVVSTKRAVKSPIKR